MNYKAPDVLISFIHAMFPGNQPQNVPAIDLLNDFEESVKSFKNVNFMNDIIIELNFDELDEINEFIKKAKIKYGSVEINVFVNHCIEYYFGHKDIITPLTNKQSPLFPNETVLDDINFDLLVPVYLRDL